ncbi:uncharacterized protein B0H18DRAFT_1026127 [Fomitopsis serialis]|uniref:uncharacterized protein n=1 Tax=Fomitopsis serialis TaxID=139415 RepID=UPI0020083ADF|nr:uncharacterized protein B0H18DRAFT_1026127 [Neoantrodia serialis]KAH9919914.1 hypothetical protein B0H18DRAFT_1026127 [Neoantrodia serialis]
MSKDENEASISETDFPGPSTSNFHAILSRNVFDQLQARSVLIQVGFMAQARNQDATMLSAIKSHMITLFAPWLDRGIVQLQFGPDPDGEEFVTRKSSPVLSCLGAHASIVDTEDSEDDGREGGARDVRGDTETEDVITISLGSKGSATLGSAGLTLDHHVVNDRTRGVYQTKTPRLGERRSERQSIGHLAGTRSGFRNRIAGLMRKLPWSRKNMQD